MSDNIFSGTPTPDGDSNTPNTNQPNDVDTILQAIKNDRGEPKYKNVQDALNALKHSQEYIPALTSKVSTLESDLEIARQAAARVAELEATVRSLTQSSNTPNNQSSGLTPEQVAELVNSTLTRKQQEDKLKENTTLVATKVAAKFGAEAEKKFYDKAAELGMTPAEFNSLAAKNPKAVFTLLGINEEAVPITQSKHNPTASSVNTSGFTPNPESNIGVNAKSVMSGSTTSELREESLRSLKMAQELHDQGMSVHDLTDPKKYFAVFKK